MSSKLLTYFERSGTSRVFSGRHLIDITGSDSVYYVKSGAVNVFSTPDFNEAHTGRREHHFTVQQGAALFGLQLQRTAKHAIFAVPVPDTELIELPLEQLRKSLQDQSLLSETAQQIDSFVDGLSASAAATVPPRTNKLIEPGQSLTLETNESIRSHKRTTWIKLDEGELLFLDMEEVSSRRNITWFPVTRNSWLQALTPARLATSDSALLLRTDEFWSSLNTFYRIILNTNEYNRRLSNVDEFNRLRERSEKNQQAKSAAMARLRSVLNPEETASLSNGTPLFAAASIAARHQKIKLQMPDVTRDEEGQLTVEDIAAASRIRYRYVPLEDTWWEKDGPAMIVFLKEKKRPVAALPVSGGGYQLVLDNETSAEVITGETAELIEERAVMFYRPFPDSTLSALDLFKFGFTAGTRDIIYVLLFGAVAGLLGLALPVFTGIIFDSIIPQSDYTQLYLLGGVIFSVSIATGIFQLLRSFSMQRVETSIDATLEAALWDRILRLPVNFFRKFTSGELASRSQSIVLLRRILSSSVVGSALSSFFALFNIALLFYYSLNLAMIAAGLIVLAILLIALLSVKSLKYQRKIIEQDNRISGLAGQFLRSISKLRIAGAEQQAFHLWADKFSTKKRAAFVAGNYQNVIGLLSGFYPILATIIIYGAFGFSDSISLSLGEFLAFIAAFTMFINSMLQLGMASTALVQVIPIFETAKPILETQPESTDERKKLNNLEGDLEVSRVSFSYDKDAAPVLSDVSLYVNRGEYAAIVGPSGSGKSTLLRLLLGFEQPDAGAVYYDRQELSTLDLNSVRKQTGTVLQNASLAPGTILKNIVGISDADEDAAWEAARLVGLESDIRAMPMGMNTVVSEGVSTLSGGQRQRIIIARALLRKPRVIFFDEATSALDNETQAIVSRSLDQLQSTRIIIAHRLSAIRNADRIYVLDKGRIAEHGTYAELAGKGGLFAQLVRRQTA